LNEEDPKLDEEGNKLPYLDPLETRVIEYFNRLWNV
jgi:hypothetical protein